MDTSETSREKNPDTDTSTDYSRSADSPSASERSLDELVDAIDAETLEARRSRTSSTARGEMPRCPECGSVKLHHKSGGPSGTRKPGAYRCDGCNHHFDEPADPDETADVVTDGGEALSESLKTALENADCHPDMVRYAEKAAERDRTPIFNSLRRFHDVSDVSRIETVGTQIERSLWKDGAEATLRRHGHVDEMNAEILKEIVEQQPVTDGNHPSGHSPGASTSDRSSAAEYFVVDEARPAVVDGPLPMARAKVLANEHGPDHIVAERSAIQLLESASNTTVRWETDDVDVVTDGGRRLARRDLVDAVQADAGVGDQGPGGCPHSDDELPCWNCLTDGEGGSQ